MIELKKNEEELTKEVMDKINLSIGVVMRGGFMGVGGNLWGGVSYCVWVG